MESILESQLQILTFYLFFRCMKKFLQESIQEVGGISINNTNVMNTVLPLLTEVTYEKFSLMFQVLCNLCLFVEW